MMQDILLGDDNDLLFDNNGHLIRGRSDEQHQKLLLITEKGAWKENPDVGVGLLNYLMDDDIKGMKAEVRTQFTKDGMTIESVTYDEVNNNLNYDAAYKS